MIQILGLRERFDQAKGKMVKHHAFHGKEWRLPTVDDVFSELRVGEILENVPANERWNLYFTVAECHAPPRILKQQNFIPFDIDGITFSSEDQVLVESLEIAKVAIKALGLDWGTVGIIFSGNGVQFFIKTQAYTITYDDYFDESRLQYKFCCDQINLAIKKAGLTGKCDSSVWSTARLMRLPNTENRKPNKPARMAKVIQRNLVAHDTDIYKLSGMPVGTPKPESISNEVLKAYPNPDTKGVLEGCDFLKWAATEQDKVSEPQWYAALSIWSRLKDGRDLCHKSSDKHPSYSFDETDMKIDQSMASSGPRTCKDVSSRWEGCHQCPYYGKITSPIMIRSKDYLASKDHGFRQIVVTKDGDFKPGPPAYQELVTYYSQQHPFITLDSSQIYQYKDTHWVPTKDPYINEWMQQTVDPAPSSHEMQEFRTRLKSYNVRAAKDLALQSDGKLNMKNCVYDVMTGDVLPHGPEHGFLYVLPFSYDKAATAPRWKQFLEEVTDGDQELVSCLKEFGGYAISGDDCWYHKGMLLIGDGANGKSIYAETLAMLVGPENCSAIPMQDLKSEYNRFSLYGKLFNYSAETSRFAMFESELFKSLTDGSRIRGRMPFGEPLEFENRAKIINLTNHLPEVRDMSYGYERRNLIVPFNVTFKDNDPRRDPFLKDKLKAEAPGIINDIMGAYRKARERQYIINPKASQEELKKMLLEADTVQQFIEENLEVTNTEMYEAKAEIYQAFSSYCLDNGYKPLSNIHFWRRARKILPNFNSRDTKFPKSFKRAIWGVKLLNKEV